MSGEETKRLEDAWTRFLARHVMRLRDGVGMSLFFRLMIRDRAAFMESVRPILAFDFERIVVGHGDIIDADAKNVFLRELEARALLPR